MEGSGILKPELKEEPSIPEMTMNISKVEIIGDALSPTGTPTGFVFVRITLIQPNTRIQNEVVFTVNLGQASEIFVGRSATLKLELAAKLDYAAIMQMQNRPKEERKEINPDSLALGAD